MQCCTCSNWAYLKCSLLSFSRFRTLVSSPSWSCPPCFFWKSHTYQHCDFLLGLLQQVYLHCSIWPIWSPSANAALTPTLAFKPLILFPPTLYLLPLHPHHRLMLQTVSLYLLLPLPLLNFLRVLQWNAGGLQARSTKLLHFISSYPFDLICIQESNLNLLPSFRIPGFSALRSDVTHSRSGIFSANVTDARGGVIIFVKQVLSFSELSTSFLSSLDPNSDYVEVNIFLKDSSSHSFLNVYAPPFRFSPKESRTNFFSSSIFPSYVETEAVEFLRFRFHRKRTASSFRFHIPDSK